MDQRDVTLIIYNLKDGDKFTFKIIKKDFPLLNYRRFHEIVKIFIHLGFVKKVKSCYKRKRDQLEEDWQSDGYLIMYGDRQIRFYIIK